MARRCNSSCTSGTSCSSASLSPWVHACSSSVTLEGLTIGNLLTQRFRPSKQIFLANEWGYLPAASALDAELNLRRKYVPVQTRKGLEVLRCINCAKYCCGKPRRSTHHANRNYTRR